ncbi:hypothetical protein ACOZ38_29500 [Sphaerisporangium viridialbum]|uniref:hypothetical protein n=1 Tax=Sphaerisporangium viridialbum TaxID=46189 RepID=UPI003C77AE7E
MSLSSGSTRGPGNASLKAARQAKRLTQEQAAQELTLLAAQLHAAGTIRHLTAVSPRQYRRWETAAPPWPRADHRVLLEHMFGHPPEALGFTPAFPVGPVQDAVVFAPLASPRDEGPAGGNLDPVDRRTLIAGAAALGLSAVGAADLPWLKTGQSSGRGPSVGAQELELLRATAADLDAIDQRFGGDRLLNLAHANLMWVHQLIEHGTYSEPIAQDLQGIAGQLTISLGWYCYDADRQELARVYYTEGLNNALLAGDTALATRVLSNMARQSIDLGKGREALRFARLAQVHAGDWSAPPRVQALLAVREAQSQATLGDDVSFRAAIKRAWTEFDRGDSDRDPNWVAFLNPAEMTTLEGMGRLRLGQHRQAVQLLDQAAAGQPLEFSRNRSMALGSLAHAAVGAQELDRAVDATHESLHLVESGLSSTRAKRQLVVVRDGLAPYQSSSGRVREVTERLAVNIA